MSESACEWVDRFIWYRTGCVLPGEHAPRGKSVITEEEAKSLNALKKQVNVDRQTFIASLFASKLVGRMAAAQRPINKLMTLVVASQWMVHNKCTKAPVRCAITGQTNPNGSIHILDFSGDNNTSIPVTTPYVDMCKLLFWWSTWPSMLEFLCDDLDHGKHVWPLSRRRPSVLAFLQQLRAVHAKLTSLFCEVVASANPQTNSHFVFLMWSSLFRTTVFSCACSRNPLRWQQPPQQSSSHR